LRTMVMNPKNTALIIRGVLFLFLLTANAGPKIQLKAPVC
jgi:hypothetical protein